VTKPISTVGRINGARRTGGRRAGDAPRADKAAGPESVAKVSAPSCDPTEAPLAISAQIIGQSDSAETAPLAKTAEKARTAYLDVEWSGGADRRNNRGRIAKTQI